MITSEQIQQKILQALPGSRVQVQDTTGTFDHFDVVVVSDHFQNKSLVEQHQLVYRALGDAMREAIHALALKTYTPEQLKTF